MKRHTLSVIIPTYNVQDYIGKCLDSLIVDREDLEVLVVIDGSKDSSCDIAKTYQERYPSIFKVIEKDNGHYGSCVNVGLSLASGKYVKILDADDFFDAQFAEYLSFLSQIDADVILSDSISEDFEGGQMGKITFPLPQNEVLPISVLAHSNVSIMHHHEVAYKRELLTSIQYHQTEGISYTDLEWSTLPFSMASSIFYFPLTVYHYLRGRVGQSIDIGYRRNNIWMEDSVVLGLARSYERLKEGIAPENETILRTFISSLVRQIYFHYLVNFRGILNMSELKSFDDDLKGISETLYESVHDVVDIRKFGTFKYIKDYRTGGLANRIRYLYYDSCLAAAKLLKKNGN